MAMKWIPLDGKKDPPFETDLIAWKDTFWLPVVLKEKMQSKNGVTYTFINQVTKDELTGFTYYMIPESPKNNGNNI